MQTTDRKNIHVPLPHALHEGLREQAERLGLPATTLARTAIEEWVSKAKKAQVEEELRRYVAAMAGTESDLDEAFEVAGVETWLRRG
jgi:hypothetical protein